MSLEQPPADVPLAIVAPDVGVIRAKILPRRLPSTAIRRPSLVERLNSGRRCTLTLLSAPGGFGKTTLLAEWVADPSCPRCAWVSLDKPDTDPIRLWTHLIAALAGVEPRAGAGSLAALRAGPDQVERRVIPILLEELAGDGPEVVVILDDYHLAQNAAVDAAIGAFMRFLPARVQLVISTRADPALGVPRLRASGELAEIRAADLRFDEREVMEFFAEVGVGGLSRDDAASLADRTGGWPAPLRLLALLIGETEPSGFIASFTGGNRPVVEYLTKDVIELLEPDVQQFVQRVSILTRMCGPLCDAVVGRTGSGGVLAELERSNLFISVDTAGDWYSQHQLFAAAMRLDLARSHPELLPTLHRRAALWFEAVGDLESALDHAIEAHELDLATRLLGVQFEPLAARGRWETIRGWLSDLSWPLALADPQLAFIRATSAAFSHDLDRAERWLDLTAQGPPDDVGALGVPLGYRTDFMRDRRGQRRPPRRGCRPPRPRVGARSQVGGRRPGRARTGAVSSRFDRRGPSFATPRGGPDSRLPPEPAGLRDREPGPDGVCRRCSCACWPHARWSSRDDAHQWPGWFTVGCDPGAWFDLAIDILGDSARSAWLANAYLLQAANSGALGDLAGEVRFLDAADEILDRLPSPGTLPLRSELLRKEAPSVGRRVTEFGEELSQREVAVLRLAGRGLTQRQIADQLFISYNTVKSHLRSTYRKLGATSCEDAVSRLADLTGAPQPLPPR